jgi:hypothetical protein
MDILNWEKANSEADKGRFQSSLLFVDLFSINSLGFDPVF